MLDVELLDADERLDGSTIRQDDDQHDDRREDEQGNADPVEHVYVP